MTVMLLKPNALMMVLIVGSYNALELVVSLLFADFHNYSILFTLVNCSIMKRFSISRCWICAKSNIIFAQSAAARDMVLKINETFYVIHSVK